VHKSARLRVGQWLETDGVSKAKIDVADIGHIEVQPNTRIRLVETRSDEHRLALDRGAMEAQIMAPPRLFFVETPSAVAVDLGCAYTLKVDEVGRGLLHVTLGWVSFEREGRESIVPAGALCETRPAVGPGTPYFEDTPLPLRTALTAFDFEQGGAEALEVVLEAARQRDSLTLWHLLPRTTAAEREAVYGRLKALVRPPETVTREGIMRLDSHLLKLWWERIENTLWDEVDPDEIDVAW
jgi:hypothetical protein